MNQFTFEGKQRTVLLGGMVLGLVCLVLTFFIDPLEGSHHARFWSNLLHNTVFFTGIAFISLFVMCAFTTAYAGWFVGMKRLWEAMSLFLIVGLVLLLIIVAGLWGHLHHLYHWNVEGVSTLGHENYDRIIAGKSGFLNKYWYTFGTIIFVGVWYMFARKIRSLSLQEDTSGTDAYTHFKKIKFWSAFLLPIGAFTSAAMIWQWVMSIDAHWYSTMYAWYSSASWFVSATAFTILMLIYLKGKGYYQNISDEHLHDFGKFLFAFSVFWTYLWFSQYMLIWYSNNGEETIYFRQRLDSYPVLFYGNLVMNFVLPFLILMRNSTKRKHGTLILVSLLTFFGHWWDFFYMIKPGVVINAGGHADHGAGDHSDGHEVLGAAADHGEHASSFMAGYTLPGLLELGIFIGFLSLFIYFVFMKLKEASLVPENDPYMKESVHHHV